MMFLLKNLFYFIIIYITVFIFIFIILRALKKIKKFLTLKKKEQEKNNIKIVKKPIKDVKKTFNKSLGVWEIE